MLALSALATDGDLDEDMMVNLFRCRTEYRGPPSLEIKRSLLYAKARFRVYAPARQETPRPLRHTWAVDTD